MRVVLDTNVLVSALLNPRGVPAEVTALAVRGRLRVMYDARIVTEYRAVTSRSHFAFDPQVVETFLDATLLGGEAVAVSPLDFSLPDLADLPFAEVALAGSAEALITGNARHFEPLRPYVPVHSPTEFLQLWRERHAE